MNCKEGDMAWIVDAPNTDPLGRVATVISLVGRESHARRHKGSPLWHVHSELPIDIVEVGPITDFTAPDSALRPIRPGDLHETEDERKEVEA